MGENSNNKIHLLRSSYHQKAMEQIRNSLQPFATTPLLSPSSSSSLTQLTPRSSLALSITSSNRTTPTTTPPPPPILNYNNSNSVESVCCGGSTTSNGSSNSNNNNNNYEDSFNSSSNNNASKRIEYRAREYPFVPSLVPASVQQLLKRIEPTGTTPPPPSQSSSSTSSSPLHHLNHPHHQNHHPHSHHQNHHYYNLQQQQQNKPCSSPTPSCVSSSSSTTTSSNNTNNIHQQNNGIKPTLVIKSTIVPKPVLMKAEGVNKVDCVPPPPPLPPKKKKVPIVLPNNSNNNSVPPIVPPHQNINNNIRQRQLPPVPTTQQVSPPPALPPHNSQNYPASSSLTPPPPTMTAATPPPPPPTIPPPPHQSSEKSVVKKPTLISSPIPQRKNNNNNKNSKTQPEEFLSSKVRCVYSPQAFKFFMEQHVENVIKSHQERLHRRMQLESEMAKIGLSEEAQTQMRRMLSQKESNYIRLKRAKMDKTMFKPIRTIGVGAFGEVALVQKIDSQPRSYYAMKTLRKSDVLRRNQVAHVKAERDILAEADNEWVVKLYYSFQDTDNLYFVMDYIPGGDLMSLLIKKGIFEEDLARFYIAELTIAIESVHRMGFIHRDIKPDNILIDRDGHIKLTDFGLCTGFRWTHNSKYYSSSSPTSEQQQQQPCNCPTTTTTTNTTTNSQQQQQCTCSNNILLKPLETRRNNNNKNRAHHYSRCLAHSLVGTPNYIAPEVLMRIGYTQLCDWWSVGVILYEMLVGQPPFLANTPAETQYKVINFEKTLKIPGNCGVQKDAKDLIVKLCTDHGKRLGRGGALEVKKHPFFKPLFGDDPEDSQQPSKSSFIRRVNAPYTPVIRGPTDTSNFDFIDDDELDEDGDNNEDNCNEDDDDAGFNGEQFHGFYEFTFRRFFDDAYNIGGGGNSGGGGLTLGGMSIDDVKCSNNNNLNNGNGPVYV